MNKQFTGYVKQVTNLELFFEEFVLPEYGIAKNVVWGRHVKTDPDNFLHVFVAGDVRYALAFDDYPSSFSVYSDPSVKSMKLPNGDEMLNISSPYDKYAENVTGAFMLFQVIDDTAFEIRLDYLEVAYEKLLKTWDSQNRTIVAVTRDVLRLAEMASLNNDRDALYSIETILEALVLLEAEDNNVEIAVLQEYIKVLLDEQFDYEFYSPEDKARLRAEIYKSLAKEVQDSLKIQKYEVTSLGQTVRLVTAMYTRVNGELTEGISVAILFDRKDIKYPANHFIDGVLKKYFADNDFIAKSNIEDHMPLTLRDYRLVAGSVQVHDIFQRELQYVSF